jgi:hypothetical protein
MSDDREWFVPKRYGFGATPITWQGWALTIGFALITIALAVTFARRPVQLFAIEVPLLTVFIVITAKTTRGGWRWRWGEED